jgi:hypothetical protein
MKVRHSVLIGEATAELLKMRIGSAHPRYDRGELQVWGRSLRNGLAACITVQSGEIREAITEQLELIAASVKAALEETPPELSADIFDTGIMLTGGCSLIPGLPQLLEDSTGIRVAMTQAELHLEEGGKMILSGALGATGIQKLSTFFVGFLLIIFTLLVVLNLINSKEGRAIKAVRDNRIAAESVGINTTAFRLKAFVVSAFLAGMAGALYGLNYSAVAASKFSFTTSIDILVFVVLGGMGNILGSVISATVLYVLPEAMRGLQDYRMILYAIVLILVMLFTWSPKFKDLGAVAKAKIFGNKEKKEVGSK